MVKFLQSVHTYTLTECSTLCSVQCLAVYTRVVHTCAMTQGVTLLPGKKPDILNCDMYSAGSLVL